ncbi:MAG TPA: hypothetical protein VER96_15075 [Polyangiaceae bacterium]|nr:hypothetical protein [Polyangiaceae bacterium]
MNSVFARALVALSLIALPTSALAATKREAKADKGKHEAKAHHAKHSRDHASVAQKEQPAKKTKHHGHKSTAGDGLASNQSGSKAKAH